MSLAHLIRCVHVHKPRVALPAWLTAAEVYQGLSAQCVVGVPHQLPITPQQHLATAHDGTCQSRESVRRLRAATSACQPCWCMPSADVQWHDKTRHKAACHATAPCPVAGLSLTVYCKSIFLTRATMPGGIQRASPTSCHGKQAAPRRQHYAVQQQCHGINQTST